MTNNKEVNQYIDDLKNDKHVWEHNFACHDQLKAICPPEDRPRVWNNVIDGGLLTEIYKTATLKMIESCEYHCRTIKQIHVNTAKWMLQNDEQNR